MGLEVHIETNSKTKMFCGCSQDHFAKTPNSQTCPICLGLPGALPFTNKEAVLKTVKLGLALNCKISKFSKFFRKHYFYPDLPKGYQVSQLDSPLCIGGELLGKKINHIHLEEDAGKLIHETIDNEKTSLIDFNRSGCSLIEIVTEPVFHEVYEVIEFLKELQLISRYIDISDCDMEKGSMRLEANISLSSNEKLPNYKVELKNINSFKFLDKAINAEILRQENVLDNKGKLIQETRGYDEIKKTTFSQRSKEASHDYRYFPEADLPPIVLDDSDIKKLKLEIEELPSVKRERFLINYAISKEYVDILVSDINKAKYFEEAVKIKPDLAKTIANLMINKNMDKNYEEPTGLVKKIVEITKVNYSTSDEVLKAIRTVIENNPDVVISYQSGKGQVIGFLIGQVQKILNGKADAKVVIEKLKESLHK